MEKSWIDDPLELFSSVSVLPSSDGSKCERINSMTRLVLLISLFLYIMDYKYWLTFLIVGLAVMILMKYQSDQKEDFSMNNRYVSPQYMDCDCPTTVVPPLHAEEWQIPTPQYNTYELVTPVPEEIQEEPSFASPYGRYISTSNIPTYATNVTNLSLNDARMVMEDSFTRDTMQFRDDMTRIYKNKLDREYRHGCFDSISPYTSF